MRFELLRTLPAHSRAQALDSLDVSPPLPSREIIALNRLAFGPRPGDVGRLTTLGFESWLEQQLHPADLADAGLQSRLAEVTYL
jgi:hypothetical protein